MRLLKFISSKGKTKSIKNGATIQYNKSVTDGGGIYVNGANSSIFMENSSIENNVGCKGACIYSMKDGARVYLEKGSAIQ